MNRRTFNKILLGTTALSFVTCASIADTKLPTNKKRVVIVGGGFGGATAAKYLKKFSPDTEVILIEQNKDWKTDKFNNDTKLNEINFCNKLITLSHICLENLARKNKKK